MSNFWASQLAKRANPNARIPVAPPPAHGTAWWQTPPPAPPATMPQAAPPAPGGVAQYGTYPASANPIQAQSIKQAGRCPHCGGGDYYAPTDQPNATPRCFECGHRPGHVAPAPQPLGSMRHAGDNVTATRQIHDGSSNFSWQLNEKIG